MGEKEIEGLLLPGGQSPGFRRFENGDGASCRRKKVGKLYAERKVSLRGKAVPLISRAAECGSEME